MRSLIILVTAFLGMQMTTAQSIVAIEAQEDLSTDQLADDIGGPYVEYPVYTFKVRYQTIDVFGNPTIASGMLAVPYSEDEAISFPIAIYNHGTVSHRNDVPSRLGTNERTFVNAIATNGYITVAPDYLGLGDNQGLHPYVHADSEAQVGYDLLIAIREWLGEENISFSDQLFLTGYSQGGHASMALQQKIQEDATAALPPVTAAAHLSGPYSISDVMVDVLFDPEVVTSPGYLVYTYVSYNYVYGLYDSLEKVFVEPYVGPIKDFFNQYIDLNDLNRNLSLTLNTQRDDYIDMFQDSFAYAIRSDYDHRFAGYLRENDTYNFAPTSPTLLVYCTEDEQVSYRNTTVADSVMTNVLGSDQVTTYNGGENNHRGCVVPSALQAIGFFRYHRVLSETEDFDQKGQLFISPNPARPLEYIDIGQAFDQPVQLDLVNAAGKISLSTTLSPGQRQIRLPKLAKGVYYLYTRGEYLTINKILIQ